VTNKILIDECLTAALVEVARKKGFVADYVTWIGLKGAKDWTIVPHAIDNDFIVATNNRRDFLREYTKHALHNGLIVIVPQVERDAQIVLFGRALDVIVSSGGDIVNKVVEVLLDGSVHIREWAREDNDPAHSKNPEWK
jgi:hypothetical protein